MSKQLNWSELSQEERDKILQKFNCSVKVRLNNGIMFEFNPFRQCASMPPQFCLNWLPLYENDKPKRQFMFCDDVFRMVAMEGIESDNVEYLKEAKFDTKNIKFYDFEDDKIWEKLKKEAKSNNRDLSNIDDEYKKQLIKGHKLWNGKIYDFKTIEDEEEYFMRDDVTPEEVIHYYEFIVKWSESHNLRPEGEFLKKIINKKS